MIGLKKKDQFSEENRSLVFISDIYYDSTYAEDRLMIKPCPPSEP